LQRSEIVKALEPFVPSDEQMAIFEAAVNTKDNIGIDAKAGTGKTTSIVQLAKLLPGGKSMKKRFCAFNKPIADELADRLKDTGTDAKTFHSMGVGALIRYFGGKQMNLDDRKYKKLVQAWLALPDEPEWAKEVEQPRELALKVRELVVQTVSKLPPDDRKEIAAEMNKQFIELMTSVLNFLRLKLIGWTDTAALRDLIDHYSFQDTLPDEFVDVAVEIVPYLMGLAEQLVKKAFEVDFTDQIYWAVYWQIPTTQYDYLLADECLPYLTPVQLADGSALPIGEIVEKRLSVKVLAYDTATGEQRACEVTGWSRTLNQKPLVKIKARWTKSHKDVVADGYKQRPTNFVVCTVDHKIWANGTWMYAGDVRPRMVVQVETGAIKSQAYKITTSGRETLSSEMTAKNREGIVANHRGGSITVRGGNGRGLTLAQSVLLEALGEGWTAEYAVKTGLRQDSGYPTSYKVDIANPERMIAVEVDGETHRNPVQKQRDQKKQALLETLGWTVLRFSNRQCIQTTQQCVQAINDDCPLDAIVASVEPMSLPDNFVYDITVADCHNFYANGILVHNCQDINPMQRTLLARSIKPNGGRIIFVGDPDQSIMNFAGADSDSFELSVKTFNAKVLPLTLTRRCDQVITHHAAQLVPEFRCPPEKPRGKFVWLDESRMAGIVQPGDMVVCRMKAPLVTGCLNVIAEGKPATILGSDIEKGLIALLEKRSDYKDDFDNLDDALDGYEAEQVEHFTARDELQAADAVADQCAALRTIIHRAKADDMDALKRYIETLFSSGKKEDMVVFVTAHKSKGLEADRVFILAPDRMPLSYPNMLPESAVQEMNLLYVALTRAKHTLVILTNEKYRKNNVMPAYGQTDFDEHQWAADEFEPKPPQEYDYVYNSRHDDFDRVPVNSPVGETTIDEIVQMIKDSGVEGWDLELSSGFEDNGPSQWVLAYDDPELVDDIILGSNLTMVKQRLEVELKRLANANQAPPEPVAPAPVVITPIIPEKVDKLRAVVATLTDVELEDMIRYLSQFREERRKASP